MAPHSGLHLLFSLFFKAELYKRDLKGGHYTLLINSEEEQRRATVYPSEKGIC